MNRLRPFLLGLVLLLALSRAHSQTAIWLDGFETNKHWVASGSWHIGVPSHGPSTAYAGSVCAGTDGYAYNSDGRIYCTNYLSSSNTIVVPDASLSPALTFFEWHNFANALGYVEIYTSSNGWQQLSGNYTGNSSSWELSSNGLSAYSGQKIKIGFHFTSGGCCGNAEGWFVDKVAVTVTITTPPTVIVPTNVQVFAGATLQLQLAATNSALPNDSYHFRLISGPRNVTISSGGLLSWQTAAQQPTTNVTFTVQATDDENTPQLSATGSFTAELINQWIPTFMVDPEITNIYEGQSVSVTALATNYFPEHTFTYSLLTNHIAVGATNADLSQLADGTVSWDGANTHHIGTFTNFFVAQDDFTPNYSATNQFVITISKPPPPTLILPSSTNIYAGQLLIMTLAASDDAFPDGPFTYAPLSPTNRISVVDDVLTWTNSATNRISSTIITLTVSNETSQLTSTNSFSVIRSPTPPPMITTPGHVTNYVGNPFTVTNYATNIVFSATTFIFKLLDNFTNVTMDTNGVLIWTNTYAQNGVLVWSNAAPRTIIISIMVTNLGVTNPYAPALATNHFDVVLLPPLPPIVTGPTYLTVGFGRTLNATYSASSTNKFALLTNVNFIPITNTFTWAASTNGIINTNGVFVWTNTNAAPGNYSVLIFATDNNQPPLIGSNTLFLTVLSSSQIILTNPVVLTNGHNFTFSVKTIWTNSNFIIFASTNLSAPPAGWVPISTNKTGPNGVLQFTDMLSTNFPRRFYRAAFQ